MKTAICQLLFFSLQNGLLKRIEETSPLKRVEKTGLLEAESTSTRRVEESLDTKKEKLKSEPAPAPENEREGWN